MNKMRELKAGNSKGQLVRAILTFQRALAYYASDAQWVQMPDGKFQWNDSRSPTEVAKIVLGLDKEEVKPAVRLPDKKIEAPNDKA